MKLAAIVYVGEISHVRKLSNEDHFIYNLSLRAQTIQLWASL